MEEEEEGTFESIHSSYFTVEGTEVQSGKVKCLKSHSTWGIRVKCGHIHITTCLVRLAHSHTAAHTTYTRSYAHNHSTDAGAVPWVAVVYGLGCSDASLSWSSWDMPARPLTPPLQPSDYEVHYGSTAFKNLGSCSLWVCSEHSLETHSSRAGV